MKALFCYTTGIEIGRCCISVNEYPPTYSEIIMTENNLKKVNKCENVICTGFYPITEESDQ